MAINTYGSNEQVNRCGPYYTYQQLMKNNLLMKKKKMIKEIGLAPSHHHLAVVSQAALGQTINYRAA